MNVSLHCTCLHIYLYEITLQFEPLDDFKTNSINPKSIRYVTYLGKMICLFWTTQKFSFIYNMSQRSHFITPIFYLWKVLICFLFFYLPNVNLGDEITGHINTYEVYWGKHEVEKELLWKCSLLKCWISDRRSLYMFHRPDFQHRGFMKAGSIIMSPLTSPLRGGQWES